MDDDQEADATVGTVRVERCTDWQVLKALRLRALRADEHAFGSRLRDEEQWSDSRWRAAAGAARWVVARAGGAVIGVARSADPEPHDRERFPHIEAVWVEPRYRRLRVASRLVAELLRWERERGASELRVWIVVGNHAAKALYRRLGFVLTDQRQPLTADPNRSEERLALRLDAR